MQVNVTTRTLDNRTLIRIDGELTALSKGASRLLRLLAQNAGRIVSYPEIWDALDPDLAGENPQHEKLLSEIRSTVSEALDGTTSDWPAILESRDDIPNAQEAKRPTWGHRLIRTKNKVGVVLRLHPPDVLVESAS